MLEVIAVDFVKSSGKSAGAVTAMFDSLLVRTRYPRRSATLGSEPFSLHRCRSRLVPSAPAATTTPRARRVLGSRRTQAPERTEGMAYPAWPVVPLTGLMSVTVRSAIIVTPARSANHR